MTTTIGRVRNRLAMYRRQGLVRSGRVLVDRAALEILRRIFGFAPWHSQSPISARSYRTGVAEMATSLAPDTVVEVGCGLGANLSRIKAPHRIGYDTDEGAVRAGRFLHRGKIEFRHGGFEDVSEQRIDVLIAVNWIHEHSPEQLQRWLDPLLARVGYVIVDSIDRGSPTDYLFYHDFAFLTDRARRVREHSFGEAHRSFILFEVMR